MELISLHQPEEFEKGQNETPHVRLPPWILLSGIHLGWTRHAPPGRTLESGWLAKDNPATNPITIKTQDCQPLAELFSCVPLPSCSPLGCPFPIKSLALSVHVSPRTIHFQVLDKSLVLGPGRGPPSCNKWRLWQGLFFTATDIPTTWGTQGPACLPMDQIQWPQLGPFVPGLLLTRTPGQSAPTGKEQETLLTSLPSLTLPILPLFSNPLVLDAAEPTGVWLAPLHKLITSSSWPQWHCFLFCFTHQYSCLKTRGKVWQRSPKPCLALPVSSCVPLCKWPDSLSLFPYLKKEIFLTHLEVVWLQQWKPVPDAAQVLYNMSCYSPSVWSLRPI